MELEAVELRCLTYLQQVSNPVVPLTRLVSHLRQFDDCGEIEEGALLDFLRHHDLFEIFDPYAAALPMPINPEEARTLGISTDPRVILATRVPTRAETCALMKETIAGMAKALENAVHDANQRYDLELRANAEALLQRLRALEKELARQG